MRLGAWEENDRVHHFAMNAKNMSKTSWTYKVSLLSKMNNTFIDLRRFGEATSRGQSLKLAVRHFKLPCQRSFNTRRILFSSLPLATRVSLVGEKKSKQGG